MSSKVWVKEYLNMMYLHLSPGTSHCSKREQRLLKSQFVEIFSLHNYPNRHSEMDNRNEIRKYLAQNYFKIRSTTLQENYGRL